MGNLVVEGLELVVAAREAAIAKLRREVTRSSERIDRIGRQLDALVDLRRATLNRIATLEKEISAAQHVIYEEGGKAPLNEELRLYRSGKKLDAVMSYKGRHKCSLMEAKHALEAWA